MDYYATLGINRNASDSEIKDAYRKMAMKHHPDRGGDETSFKNVTEAYEALKNPETRKMYDQFGSVDPRQRQYRSGDFQYDFDQDPFGMGDLFRQFGFGFQNRQRNNNINIAVDISLEDVLQGKTIGIEIQLANGRTKVVTIDIPPGVEHGQSVRYQGMGDDSYRQIRPGDLIIQVRVRNHPVFKRIGDNIQFETAIDVFNLMLGSKTSIRTLDGKSLEINIPSGTQPDTVLSCKGEGLPNSRTRQRGNLYVKIKALIPKDLSPQQLEEIRKIRYGI